MMLITVTGLHYLGVPAVQRTVSTTGAYTDCSLYYDLCLQIVTGSYSYNFGDHGNVIVLVPSGKLVTELL